MKYLRKFETEADVNMSVVPNVVLVGDTGRVIYNVFNGVYIQHIDGTLYTSDEWTAGGFANDQANGVAVGKEAVQFVIAKENALSSTVKWSTSTILFEGVFTTDTGNVAKNDYNGVSNTKIIAENDEGSAAYLCRNYIFPNKARGYLPSAGDWALVKTNLSAINAAMTAIGGSSILSGSTQKYWSSTQVDATMAWNGRMYSGGASPVNSESKSSLLYVRPFTTL